MIQATTILRWLKLHFEAFVWILALILLAFMSPDNTQATLCIWHYAGFDACPGCGLGHSISSAFHGDFSVSFQQHPLGIAAIILLLARIVRIFVFNRDIFTPKTSITHDKNL